jgi:hypothetical protein
VKYYLQFYHRVNNLLFTATKATLVREPIIFSLREKTKMQDLRDEPRQRKAKYKK